ncbi:MAG: AraC family transcriptional regulator [Gammaproteobacteria bacterium]|nr:MAG: AraC family transcriptional regulator [Gammaproteobacteria bacterium]
MISNLNSLAPSEGFTLTHIEGVKLYRQNHSSPRSPVLYEPSIVIVCQGNKIGYLGQETFHYNAQQFLVLSVPLPFESETIATDGKPFFAILIRLDLSIISELLLALDCTQVSDACQPKAIVSTTMDDNMVNAVTRLLNTLESKDDSAIIGQSIIREIHYRALTSEQCSAVRAALSHQNNVGKVGKALRLIHSNFASELNVNRLAAEAGMSVAAFHANFKTVTTTSPMQYLKKTRLHKARTLMIQGGGTAASTALQVGYESSSQFSREYKRLFGRSPMEDVNEMKHSLNELPVDASSSYVIAQ